MACRVSTAIDVGVTCGAGMPFSWMLAWGHACIAMVLEEHFSPGLMFQREAVGVEAQSLAKIPLVTCIMHAQSCTNTVFPVSSADARALFLNHYLPRRPYMLFQATTNLLNCKPAQRKNRFFYHPADAARAAGMGPPAPAAARYPGAHASGPLAATSASPGLGAPARNKGEARPDGQCAKAAK